MAALDFLTNTTRGLYVLKLDTVTVVVHPEVITHPPASDWRPFLLLCMNQSLDGGMQ
jgi:hypothetical protein